MLNTSHFSGCTLISEEDLRQQLGRLNPNLRYEALQPAIGLAHDLDLLPLLGSAQVDELCTQLQNDALTPANQSLLQQLRPAAAWAVLYRYLSAVPGVTLAPEGPLERLPESDFRPAAPEQTHRLTGLALRNMAYYKRVFASWLAEHLADYPLVPEPPACSSPPTFLDRPFGSADL